MNTPFIEFLLPHIDTDALRFMDMLTCYARQYGCKVVEPKEGSKKSCLVTGKLSYLQQLQPVLSRHNLDPGILHH